MNDNTYDIVILGAGLGGLLSGALLAKEGYKVCIVEKNKQIGGCLQSFGFDKKLFESAVHYVGSLDQGQTLHTIFSYLGIMDQLKLRRLDMTCFDEIVLNDHSYSLAQGYDEFVNKLSVAFPEEQQNLKRYTDEVQYVCQHFPMYHLRLGSAQEKSKVSYQGLKGKLDLMTTNNLLKQVLTGNNLLYAGHYEYTPFYLHALIENSYIESSWKCEEGSAQIARLLQEKIKEYGGEVIRNSDIEHLVEKDGVLIYAEDKDHRRYYAKHFISNIHPQLTFRMLESNMIRPAMIKRLNSLQNTISSFMVNVSLKEGVLPYKNHNVYYHTSDSVWKDLIARNVEMPTSFGIFMNESKQYPGFSTSLSILCYQSMKEVENWRDTFHTTSLKDIRAQSYQDYKQQYIDSIIHSVSQFMPDLKLAIHKTDACSPLTFRDYLNTPDGSMYGIQKDIRFLAETTIATRTRIPNLYLTGQNINLHGVLGVSITSVLTAAEFVGLEYLVGKMNGGE